MTKPKLTLYHANWSLCSQMVRVALFEKGLEFDHVPIKLCDHYEEAENITKDYLKNINPTGVVPVLKIDDELVEQCLHNRKIRSRRGKQNKSLAKDKAKREILRNWV